MITLMIFFLLQG